jgi:hypothetical protein
LSARTLSPCFVTAACASSICCSRSEAMVGRLRISVLCKHGCSRFGCRKELASRAAHNYAPRC